MSWRASSLAREAWRNVTANAVRSLVVVVIGAAAVGTLAFLDLHQAADLAAFVRDYTAAGGYVAVVSGQGERLSAGRCEQLNGLAHVVAAGGVRPLGTLSVASAPGVLFQSAAVTEGALRVWARASVAAATPGLPSYILGTAAANELGLRAGSYLAVAGQPVSRVSAVLDMQRRNPQAQRWLLEVTPASGTVDECWVELDRNGYQPGLASLAAWFATGSKEPVVRPYIRSGEFTRAPAQEFAERPQRFGWLVVGGLIGAVVLLSAWFRRAELGLYLAVGTSRLDLLGMLALESLLLVAAGAILGPGYAFAAERFVGGSIPWDHARIALRSGGMGALLGLGLAPWLASAVARGNLAAMLKDR